MTLVNLAPPEAELCLTRSRVASYKGGTLVDESVTDLATHAQRLAKPDGYRPARCPRCGVNMLHIHTYPERRPRGEEALPVVRIVQFRCSWVECGATWRVLPGFLARHLWRVWRTVERVLLPQDTSSSSTKAPAIPKQTQKRWRARAASSARMIIVLLAASGVPRWEALARGVGLDARRVDLVEMFARATSAVPGARLAPLAALVHGLERGVRLI
jgi:hypothetical protein